MQKQCSLGRDMDTQEQQTSLIEMGMKQLTADLGTLETKLSILSEKLVPVLSEEISIPSPANQETTSARRGTSNLFCCIEDLDNHLLALINTVERLSYRIET